MGPGAITQTFKINHSGQYFAALEFGTSTLTRDAVECLTGVTGFSRNGACTQKPILNFNWRLVRDGVTAGVGQYGNPERGGGVLASTVRAEFASFTAQRGDVLTLSLTPMSDLSILDATHPELLVNVNENEYEYALVLRALSGLCGVIIGVIGACFLGAGYLRTRRMQAVYVR
jgi:uncharacterized protein (DUF2237 family)